MKKIEMINLKGEKVKEIKLNENIFGIEVNTSAIKKAVRLQLDASRQGTADTKNRSEVSGGGRKPYRQKGTGNARQGSIRATQYRHGGIVFGPTPRKYGFKINKKERVLALKSVLADKMKNDALIIVDTLEIADLKTKTVKNLINTLKLEGKILFVTKNDAENLYMASRNLGYVDVMMAEDINVYDILNADTLVCDEEAIKTIEEALN